MKIETQRELLKRFFELRSAHTTTLAAVAADVQEHAHASVLATN